MNINNTNSSLLKQITNINKLLDLRDLQIMSQDLVIDLYRQGFALSNSNIQSLSAFPTQIQHVIVVGFESQGLDAVMADPYMAGIANKYALAANYVDTCNYVGGGYSCWCSLPSYTTLTSGTTKWNGTDVCGTDIPPGGWWSNNSENIFDLVNKAGLTYAGYAESDSKTSDYVPCSTTNITPRHFPPVFYSSVHNDTTNGSCTSKLRPFTDWQNNILNGNETPANFVWIAPNICNDGHNCGLSATSSWLKNIFKFDTLVTKPWFQNAAIVFVYDDAARCCDGKMYFVIASPLSKAGYKSSVSYNHYNAISTFEWLLGLPATGNGGDDPDTKAMTDMFNIGNSFGPLIFLGLVTALVLVAAKGRKW